VIGRDDDVDGAGVTTSFLLDHIEVTVSEDVMERYLK